MKNDVHIIIRYNVVIVYGYNVHRSFNFYSVQITINDPFTSNLVTFVVVFSIELLCGPFPSVLLLGM